MKASCLARVILPPESYTARPSRHDRGVERQRRQAVRAPVQTGAWFCPPRPSAGERIPVGAAAHLRRQCLMTEGRSCPDRAGGDAMRGKQVHVLFQRADSHFQGSWRTFSRTAMYKGRARATRGELVSSARSVAACQHPHARPRLGSCVVSDGLLRLGRQCAGLMAGRGATVG